MIRRSVILVAVVSMFVIAHSSSASAGGWWTSIGVNQHVATGQKLEFVTNQVLFQSTEEAELAESQTFFAYVLQGVDQQMLSEAMSKGYSSDWWDPTGARAIEVGTVSVGGSQTNMVHARADIDLTGVEPGNYLLMFCDAGCEHALADLVPTEITVLEDPLLARVANRVEDLRWRDLEIKYELARKVRKVGRESADNADIKPLKAQVNDLQTLIQRTEDSAGFKNGELTSRISALENDSSDNWLTLVWLLLGLVIGGFIAVLLVRRERRRHLVAEDLEMERELLKLQ